VKLPTPRLLAALVGCVGVAAIAAPATASAAPPTAAPRVSVSIPAAVASGAGTVATGKVTPFEGRGKVQLQSRGSGRWTPLASGAVRHGRFRIAFVLDGSAAVSVRAALLAGGRIVAASPVRLVQVRQAAAPAPSSSPPATPAAESQPSPSQPPPPSTPPVEPPAEPPVEPPPASSAAYWGAWIGPQLTGTPAPEDMGAVTEFEKLAGKPLSLLETFSQWATCSGASPTCEPSVPFPRAQFEAMRGYGAIPLYSWATEGNGEANAQPTFQLADIAAGDFDSYIRRWATEAKAWGHPFFLRFDWEMNGDWFPWSESVNGNGPGDYVAAWRHVHDIFAEVGAANATWVWCPYVNPNGNLQSAATLYPGDEYVDWTCLDGYNRGTTASPTAPYRSFDYLFGPSYREITTAIAPAKPMLLAEVASSEHGGSKAQWIAEMFAGLPVAYPQVRGLMWFDYYDQGNDWPIETSPAATEAFATGIGDPRYLTNSFAGTAGGPVPVP
jgi:Glycosyl hydrolase family 26